MFVLYVLCEFECVCLCKCVCSEPRATPPYMHGLLLSYYTLHGPLTSCLPCLSSLACPEAESVPVAGCLRAVGFHREGGGANDILQENRLTTHPFSHNPWTLTSTLPWPPGEKSIAFSQSTAVISLCFCCSFKNIQADKQHLSLDKMHK